MVQGLGSRVKWAQAFFRLPRTSVRVTRLALNNLIHVDPGHKKNIFCVFFSLRHIKLHGWGKHERRTFFSSPASHFLVI